MCNINFLCKKNKGLDQADVSFLEMVSQRSFERNNDGEGYVTPETHYVSKKKIYLSKQDSLIGQPWIALHERLATHGTKEEENVQPLMESEIILLHNGVLHASYDKIKSDSRLLAESINEDIKDKGLEDAIVDNLSDASGSKSIMIINRNNMDLYYYKNRSTSFYMAKGKGEFFASTNKENVEIASNFYGWSEPDEVKEDVLFKIENGKLKKLKAVVEYQSWNQGNSGYNNSSAYEHYYGCDAWGDTDFGVGLSNSGTTHGEIVKIPATKLLTEGVFNEYRDVNDIVDMETAWIAELFDAYEYRINETTVSITIDDWNDSKELNMIAETIDFDEKNGRTTYEISTMILLKNYGSPIHLDKELID